MRPVVSDSGPLDYLVLIDAIDILPKLFGRVLIPEIVAIELSNPATPQLFILERSRAPRQEPIAQTSLQARNTYISGSDGMPGGMR